MNVLIQEIIRNPFSTLLIIGNLVLIESMLSVDNAAILATMVMHLPRQQRRKALKYGLIGAYFFRGICLLLASYLIKIWWLKGAGGIYLLYLSMKWWIEKHKKVNSNEKPTKHDSKLYTFTVGRLGSFLATIISVELMDLAFSLDNVFAAVAFSQNILIVLSGVFIGILAMRFVAQGFVKLMEWYPFLEGCAFMVIGLLGIKLALSFYEHFYEGSLMTKILESHQAAWITSAITIAVFFIPLFTSLLFNFPKRKNTT